MAKKKTASRFEGIEDPAGEEWQALADEEWMRAEQKAERARAKADDPAETGSAWSFYRAPALPSFAEMATEDVKLDAILGRFVVQDGLVHDVTRATKRCRLLPLGAGSSRQFIHFAHELEQAAPEGSEPHAECMG